MYRLLGLGALALTLLLGTAACTYAPRYDDSGAWRHEYYYYPHIGVYFHLYSGDYFYRDGHSWVRVKLLPKRYVLDHRVRRILVIRDEVPYREYPSHRARYRVPNDFKHDLQHDRVEREHNRRRHTEYHQRRTHSPGRWK